MFAFAKREIGPLQRMNAAVMFGQPSGFKDNITQVVCFYIVHQVSLLAYLAAVVFCRHWSRTTAAMIIPPIAINW